MERRLAAHKAGKGAKYTRSRRPIELVGTSNKMDKGAALKLEHRIKQKPALEKIVELSKWAHPGDVYPPDSQPSSPGAPKERVQIISP
jgi:putative endonuclease